MTWRLKYTYGRDVVGYCQLRLTSRCRHPAPGQDLIPLQRLHVFAHSRDPHPAIKLWCQVPFTKSKTIFQIEIYCMQCFLKSNILKVELSMIKIGELLRKLWRLRSCFLILPPGALTSKGLKVRRSVTWANIGVPSSDVPAEVDLLHMRIERHELSKIEWRRKILSLLAESLFTLFEIIQKMRTERTYVLDLSWDS